MSKHRPPVLRGGVSGKLVARGLLASELSPRTVTGSLPEKLLAVSVKGYGVLRTGTINSELSPGYSTAATAYPKMPSLMANI